MIEDLLAVERGLTIAEQKAVVQKIREKQQNDKHLQDLALGPSESKLLQEEENVDALFARYYKDTTMSGIVRVTTPSFVLHYFFVVLVVAQRVFSRSYKA